MKARIASAVAVLALAATSLTACRSNVGTAATVSGTRISENTVSDYVDSSVTPKADSSGQQAAVKPSVLQILVFERVFRDVLSRNGGVPTAGALAASHDEAITTLTGGQTDPKGYDAQLRANLPKQGIRAALVPHVLLVQELEYALIKRLRLSNQSDLASAVRKAGVTVRINPRYGTWDVTQASFGNATTPSYLTLQTSAAPTS